MDDVYGKQVLSHGGALRRIAFVGGVGAILVALRVIDPESSSWFPLRASCGAITGLPCLFCGTTRAMHHLLNGEFGRAIYFNWLALPILAVVATMMLAFTIETVLGRHLRQCRLRFRLTPRRLGAIAGVVVALWFLQVTLAVSLHKHELLNPAGPLYSLLVR